jgi:hypothetical protein
VIITSIPIFITVLILGIVCRFVSIQGDQIFRPLGDGLLLDILENNRSRPKILATFFHGKSYALISTKMGWPTFWAICSQTRPVTLLRSQMGLLETPPLDQVDAGEQHRETGKAENQAQVAPGGCL